MGTVQENIDESIDEDFDCPEIEDSTDNLTKAQILQREADKKAVRALE